MMRNFFTSIGLALILIPTFAEAQKQARYDSLLESVLVHQKGMGSVAMSKGGQVLYSRAFGLSDNKIDAIVNSDKETRFRIGSITKMFTAVMIFQLIEEKKLTLETKLSTFFKELPNAEKITINQMLNHSSGLYNFTNDSSYLLWMTKPKSNADLLKLFSTQKPVFEAGSKNEYSNTNYVLLGFVIEKITNKSYGENLKIRIVDKLRLQHTSVGGKIKPEQNEARSYLFTGEWQEQPETDMSIPGGAGAIISTPTDLALFIESLFAGKLVSKDHLEKMKTQINGFGSGMFRFPFDSKIFFGHSGGIDGFSSMLGYNIEDSIAVSAIMNGNNGYTTNELLIGLLSIFYDKPFRIPDFKTIEINASTLQKLAGMYSSKDLPLKIEIRVEDGKLVAQATGQQTFPLEPEGENIFVFPMAGIKMIFYPEKKAFLLKQGGMDYHYTLDQ